MSKLSIIGDPHVKNKTLAETNQLFDMIEELGLDSLILGDLFDTKEVIRGKSLNLVYTRLKNSKLKFYILVGNHDYHNLDCEDHSLQVLKELPNVTVVDAPIESPYGYMLPYMHDQVKLKEALKKLPKNSILFGHLDVISFDYGNGYISESGLDLKDLKKFKNVISGHYHKYQVKDNLTYLGTPYSHSFGESNQDKYIGIWDSETLSLELKETPFPKHHTIEIDCDKGVPYDHCEEGNHVRFILTGTSENITKYKSQNNLGENTRIIERSTDEFLTNIQLDESADNLVKFKNWATEIRGLDLDTINLGITILETVK